MAAHAKKKKFCVTMPLIFRMDTAEHCRSMQELFLSADIDAFLVSGYDVLAFLQELGVARDKVILDHRLYTCSNRSISAFEEMGYRRHCASLELNGKELAHRNNGDSYMPVYGRVVLMLTANCQNANCFGCNKKTKQLFLQDRMGEQFPVKNVCAFCYNEIYNSKVYQIFSEAETLQGLGFYGYRLDFTLESAGETGDILAMAQKAFLSTENDKESVKDYSTFTKGHFKRGVE
jgi:putative protease